jgi:hypothetical protein
MHNIPLYFAEHNFVIQIAGSDDKGYDPTRKTAKKGAFYSEHTSAG